MPPDDFWRSTLREVRLILSGAARRIERERTLVEYGAWQTGRAVMFAHHAPKRFPKFRDFAGVKPSESKGPPDWRAMQATAIAINARAGGQVRRK